MPAEDKQLSLASIWIGIVRVLGSMRLGSAILFFSAVLVFFGTLAQVHLGIHLAQKEYFQSIFVVWDYPEQWPYYEQLGWFRLPMPGGYLLGGLFLVNLVFAHFRYFKPRWSHAGIALIHLGVAMLLIGQLATDLGQEDYSMWLDEGETLNYLESFRDDELYLIDRTEPDEDRVWAIPAKALAQQQVWQREEVPLTLKVLAYYPNALLLRPGSNVPPSPAPKATQGIGAAEDIRVFPDKPVTAMNERDRTSAFVEVLTPDGQSLGTWLVSNVFGDTTRPQTFIHEGREYEIGMRFRREYLPFSLTLTDFVHERYPGTQIPKNFQSDVRLLNPETGEDRDLSVYMNNPLRYGGWVFFQASFAKQDTASMFQVVKNPAAFLPYLSTIIITFGLLYQFGWRLIKRGKRMKKEAAA